jgi:hypothetical protein
LIHYKQSVCQITRISGDSTAMLTSVSITKVTSVNLYETEVSRLP